MPAPRPAVEVKLRDTAKLKGYISDAGDDSFTVTDSKTGSSETVAYADGLCTKSKSNQSAIADE